MKLSGRIVFLNRNSVFMKGIIIALCCIWPAILQAQELKETVYYMGLPHVSQAAKDYHAGKFQAGDNDITYSIADSMDTENADVRPFYIYLVSKMLVTADKSFIQKMGTICRHYMQNEPNAALGLLFSKGVKPDYRMLWARAIAEDIKLGCDGIVMHCMRTSRSLALERCTERNKDRLEIIYNMVRSNLKVAGQGR